MKPKVFIIILNWNGWRMTLACLDSLSGINTAGTDIEIIVVDNGSKDESVVKMKKAKCKYQNQNFIFTIIENKTNLGFAEGNNVGIEYALDHDADYICLLNNDTRVDKNFLIELVRTAETDERIGLAGGKIYFEKGHEFYKDRYKQSELGRVIWCAGGLIDWQNVYGSNRGVDEVDRGQYEKQVEVAYVNGCLMLIRASLLKEIGLFDNRYFLYYEDTDLSMRVKQAGYKIFYCPKSIIWHLNAGSSETGSNLHDYFTTRNRLLFAFRWASLRVKIALIRESLRLTVSGRKWQKLGIRDFYLRRFGHGSWQ